MIAMMMIEFYGITSFLLPLSLYYPPFSLSTILRPLLERSSLPLVSIPTESSLKECLEREERQLKLVSLHPRFAPVSTGMKIE